MFASKSENPLRRIGVVTKNVTRRSRDLKADQDYKLLDTVVVVLE